MSTAAGPRIAASAAVSERVSGNPLKSEAAMFRVLVVVACAAAVVIVATVIGGGIAGLVVLGLELGAILALALRALRRRRH